MDQQQQQNRRKAVEDGVGQNHPPPQPCPRCNSNNTKFCYFNNYSLSQPRFFCKGCRRYWTHGGTLRNVPVGGGCRKSKRPKLSSASASSSQTQLSLQPLPQLPPPQLMINSQDHQQLPMGINGTAATAATMMSPFYGAVSSGYLSSLQAALQAGNQPLNFGPNLGLLHGFGLPNIEAQRQQQQQQQQQEQQQQQQQLQQQQQVQQQNQDESFQSLFSTREVGSSSMADWSLGMQPGPAAEEANNSNDDDDSNVSNNINQNIPWSDFMGSSSGQLDDP